MNGEELKAKREEEYKVLTSYNKNYRMVASDLPAYLDCLDRIRALNAQITGK